jgi:hypothetical protein
MQPKYASGDGGNPGQKAGQGEAKGDGGPAGGKEAQGEAKGGGGPAGGKEAQAEKANGGAAGGKGGQGEGKGGGELITYRRYCHLYKEWELEGLLQQLSPMYEFEIVERGYEKGNWFIRVRKTADLGTGGN